MQPILGLPPKAESSPWTPHVYITGVSGTSKTPTLHRLGTGDIVIAAAGSIQGNSTAPSITGLGATWSLLARANSTSGNQNDLALWVGIVGTSSNPNLTLTWVNNGCAIIVAYQNRGAVAGVADQVTSVTNSSGGGRTFGRRINPTTRNGFVVAALASRALNGASTAGWTNFTSSNTINLRLQVWPTPPEEGTSFGYWAQANDNYGMILASIK